MWVTKVMLVIILLNLGDALSRYPLLLVVSFDGFRYDYFNKTSTPGLNAFKSAGTYTTYVRNVFPTKTFPNHHSIATGLFPESHGVLGNEVYVSNRVVNFSAEMYAAPGVTPIWTLNQLAAPDRYSGVMMWPGSGFTYQNIQPKFSQAWDRSFTWERRVDTALGWFKHRTTPANLVMLYFEEPDTSAHSYGPESIEVIGFIQRMDNITSYIRQKLANMNLLTNTNVILLSDHGMRTVTPQKIVNLTQYVDKSFFKIVDTSPVLQIYPNRGKENVVYNALNAASQNAKFSVYRRNEIPERWHYRQSSRTPPILAVADGGYAFQDLIEWYQNEILKKNNVPMTSRTTLGLHGYDNRDSCMHPFFIASGPLIKTGLSIQPFDTVDYYSLFSTILGITPEPNNGTLANVRVMLKNSHSV